MQDSLEKYIQNVKMQPAGVRRSSRITKKKHSRRSGELDWKINSKFKGHQEKIFPTERCKIKSLCGNCTCLSSNQFSLLCFVSQLLFIVTIFRMQRASVLLITSWSRLPGRWHHPRLNRAAKFCQPSRSSSEILLWCRGGIKRDF